MWFRVGQTMLLPFFGSSMTNTIGQGRSKTYNIKTASTEDRYQSVHSRSMIRVLTWRYMGCQGIKTSSCGQQRLRLRGCSADLSSLYVHVYVFAIQYIYPSL